MNCYSYAGDDVIEINVLLLLCTWSEKWGYGINYRLDFLPLELKASESFKMVATSPTDTALYLNPQPHCCMNLKCCTTNYMYNRSVYFRKGKVKDHTDSYVYTYLWKVLWILEIYSQHLCYPHGENILAVIYSILVWEQLCWQNLFTCQVTA
jgi:hypothetical protein